MSQITDHFYWLVQTICLRRITSNSGPAPVRGSRAGLDVKWCPICHRSRPSILLLLARCPAHRFLLLLSTKTTASNTVVIARNPSLRIRSVRLTPVMRRWVTASVGRLQSSLGFLTHRVEPLVHSCWAGGPGYNPGFNRWNTCILLKSFLPLLVISNVRTVLIWNKMVKFVSVFAFQIRHDDIVHFQIQTQIRIHKAERFTTVVYQSYLNWCVRIPLLGEVIVILTMSHDFWVTLCS